MLRVPVTVTACGLTVLSWASAGGILPTTANAISAATPNLRNGMQPAGNDLSCCSISLRLLFIALLRVGSVCLNQVTLSFQVGAAMIEAHPARTVERCYLLDGGATAGMTSMVMNPLPVRRYTRPPKPGVMSEPIVIGSKKSDSAMIRPVAASRQVTCSS